MKKKYYFVYKTIFEDGHYYIGQHKTDDLEDGYIGSGTGITDFLRKNPNLKYKREILCFCYSIGELNVKEIEYLGDLFNSDPLCLNRKQGGWGHLMSDKAKKNISKGVLTALENNPEIREKLSKAGKGKIPWNKGKKGLYHHSEETKQKISNAFKGEKHPMYGKSFKDFMTEEQIKLWKQHLSDSLKGHKGHEWTDEERKKQSEKHKNKKLSDNHKKNIGLSSVDRKWVNNGKINHFIKKDQLDQYLSEGYKLGKKNK
jgi:uncharacterized protein YidB (DUF937 family)